MQSDLASKVQLPLADAIQRAVTALSNNDLVDAERVCRSVLRAIPKNGDALHLLGITMHRRGHLDTAIDLLKKATAVAPKNGAIFANLCEMLRLNGELEAAISAGKRAVQMSPNYAVAHCNLGIALFDNGELDMAFAEQNRALALKPEFATALNNMGSILRKRNDLTKAEEFYRRALTCDAAHAEAGNNLVSLMLETDQSDAALQLALQQLKFAPQNTELHRSVGRAFLQLENLDQAERAFRKAIALKADSAEAMLGLGEVFQKKNHPGLALIEAQKAAAIDPKSAYAFQQMGHYEADLGNVAKAFEHLEVALQLDPDFVPALLSRGYLHMENGDMDIASSDFARVAEIKPGSVEYLFSSVRVGKIKPDDPRIVELEALYADVAKFRKAKAIAVHYSLAKCYEDVGRFDEAFCQYSLGAKLKRSVVSYDADAHDRKVDALIEMFDGTLLENLRKAANPSVQPIFVLGMPRSGTTLTESIIASHPMVYGAGELGHMQRIFRIETADQVAQLKALLLEQPAEISKKIAQYVARLNEHAPGSPRITDKMPANFLLLGLIHALLPNARIIHVARDAVDTCVSCFTRLFERSQYHSYDQVELGRYYNAYSRLMEHWGKLLPATAFHTVSYEALVNNPEAEARAMIAYCGLDWDESCLEFHTAKRRVRTASVTQVRSPMYSSSVAKWKQYESHLGPLIDTLSQGKSWR